MRKNFTVMLLACFAMPIMIFAQSTQKPYVFKQSQISKYSGGVYAVWDSVTKKYNWYSPLHGNLNLAAPIKHNTTTFESKQSNTATSIFHLVKDINNITNSNAGNYQPQFYQQHYAVLNDIAYFSANDGIHGTELWRSDGSDSGTYMLKDIEPGKDSSGITNITAANGKIYFTATTSANGTQPWISDGTSAGTHILKDLSSYGYNAPEMYTATTKKTFFFTGREHLWVSDGTEGGTKQITISDDNSNFSQPVAVGNKLFFTTYSWYYGRQLWRSDGTDTGTYALTQDPYTYYGPERLTAFKGKLYFSDDDYNYGEQSLWVSDGTVNGTVQIQNNNNIYLPEYDDINNGGPDIPFAIYNNELYFPAYDYYDNIGMELCKYNPTNSNGVVLVKDITYGYDDTNFQPYEMVSYRNGVAFKVLNSDGSATLWTTKGNESSTKPVMTFQTYNNSNFSNLYNASEYLSFEAYTPTNGYELWKSDGTTGGTSLVKDIYPAIASSYPYFTTNLGNNILFSATDSLFGKELWKSDGTSAGTQITKDINQSSSLSSIISTNSITGTSGVVVFAATDGIHGNEPFYSDGTAANTTMISDLIPEEVGSNPYDMKTINKNVYFLVQSDENNLPAIYRFKPANKTLTKLYEAPSGYSIQSAYMVADNGVLFFQLFNYNLYDNEIWRTDGTATGTFAITPGYDYYNYNGQSDIVTIGNTAFFSYNNPYYGNELYKSDGTVNGTKIVSDLYAGSTGSYPYSLIVYKGVLYFGAQDEDWNTYLWKSDGTYAGTKKVAQIAPVRVQDGDRDQSRVYCISKGLLYISAISYNTTEGLWVTDGTTNGTKLVKNINPYSNANINNLTDVNGRLYFSADDGASGNELWGSNGTLIGTILLKDITSGSTGSDLKDFCAEAGKLYFIANGALWTSTGPGNKTLPVADTALNNVSSVDNLIASGDKLFFSGLSYQYGAELYEGDVTTQAIADNKESNLQIKSMAALPTATVFPNPVKDVATVLLQHAKNANIIVLDNKGNIIWQQSNVNTTELQIPMKQYASGLYYVKIENGGEVQTLKLLKQD